MLTKNLVAGYRRTGIGGCLYDRLEAFARSRDAILLYCGYKETPDAPAASFLRERGFATLERFLPSYRDLDTFNLADFQFALDRAARQGIVLTNYASLGDAPEYRRALYDLEERAHAGQPFREVDSYVTRPYAERENSFSRVTRLPCSLHWRR